MKVWLLSLLFLCTALRAPGGHLHKDSSHVWAEERAQALAVEPLDGESRQALLERWNRLTPDVQQRLRLRFERFRSLAPDERAALALRTRRIQARAEVYYDLFSAEERERLDRLSPEKRREILLSLATEEEEEQALRLRQNLPPELAESIADQRPERRREMLAELRRRQEEKLGPAIERFGVELGLQPQVIQRLQLLPFEQRKRKFLELAKDLSTEHIASRELPPGLSAFRWERMKALEPEEFFGVLMRLRARHPDLDCLPKRGGPRQHGREGGHEMYEAMARLRALGRPSEAELLELALLTPAEREAEVVRRRRSRVLAYLREEELLSAERIDQLERLDDEEFGQMLRQLSRPPRLPGHFPAPLEELRERCLRRRGASQKPEPVADDGP